MPVVLLSCCERSPPRTSVGRLLFLVCMMAVVVLGGVAMTASPAQAGDGGTLPGFFEVWGPATLTGIVGAGFVAYNGSVRRSRDIDDARIVALEETVAALRSELVTRTEFDRALDPLRTEVRELRAEFRNDIKGLERSNAAVQSQNQQILHLLGERG